MVAERRTKCAPGREDSLFYLGNVKNPVAVLKYGDIPNYLDDSFWSGYAIWDNTRHTGMMPFNRGWAEQPQYLVDLITAYQSAYEGIRG